jgi:tetratricopeptide (TPR) repeat protein
MLFRKALDMVRQQQGESTLTLHCVENVAEVCSRQGKHEKAVELFKECLEKRQALLGNNHPDTLKTMGFLAAAYGEQDTNDEQGGNGYEQSSLLYSQCFEIQKLVLGTTHRDTLETMGLLAYVLSKQGKLLEAASLFEECLKEQKLILGENNCTTKRV